MSEYDAILRDCSIAIILLTVTIGLVPSIIRKAQWIPGGHKDAFKKKLMNKAEIIKMNILIIAVFILHRSGLDF